MRDTHRCLVVVGTLGGLAAGRGRLGVYARRSRVHAVGGTRRNVRRGRLNGLRNRPHGCLAAMGKKRSHPCDDQAPKVVSEANAQENKRAPGRMGLRKGKGAMR